MEIDSAFLSLSQGYGALSGDRTLDYKVRLQSSGSYQDIYEELALGNNIAANIIELLPLSMGKVPPVFECKTNSLLQIEIQQKIEQIIPYLLKATRRARSCGGAGLFIGTSDFDISQPLTINSEISFFVVFEGGRNGELRIHSIDNNAGTKNYGEPLYYRLRNRGALIHHSRIIPFYGIKGFSKRQESRIGHWGLPVLHRSYDLIKQLDIANMSLASGVDKVSRVVYEIDGLYELLRDEQGRMILKERLKMSDFAWNNLRALLTSKDEKVYTVEMRFDNVIDVIHHFKEMIAASADIPFQKIFNVSSGGNSLSGTNSSSSSMDRTSERDWADYVNSRQMTDWLPKLKQLVKIWMGFNQFPFEITFPSIIPLTQVEEKEIGQSVTDSEDIKGTFTSDDNRPVRRIINWNGFRLGIQYYPFELRFNKTLPCAYGHVQNTRGSDGMALDAYIKPGLTDDHKEVFAIRQVVDGKFDEFKLMIGFLNKFEAMDMFLKIMPKEFYGGIEDKGLDWLKSELVK